MSIGVFSLNFVWFADFTCQEYSSNQRWTIKRQQKIDCSSNDRTMISLSSCVLSSSEKSLVKVRGFLFEFGMVWEN